MLAILGVRLIVRGREHVSGRVGRIVPFNHASTLDIFIVQAILPDGGVPVAKREFIRVPMPHGQGWSRGGTIVVEFLPPIAPGDDTLDNLRGRTDMLRDRFVAALARLDP